MLCILYTAPVNTASQMERAAPNTYGEEENCHFADDSQLKVTFKKKTNGFRYYICPLGCMWD